MTSHQTQQPKSRPTIEKDDNNQELLSPEDDVAESQLNEGAETISEKTSTATNKTTTDTTTTKLPPPQQTEIRVLHPFVHWAQSQTHISLRVDLSQVEDSLNASIEDSGDCLTFFARGKGAQGLQDYNFSLDFYSKVEKKIECHSIERYVLILIEKTNKQVNWPRLTKQHYKLPWLRVDFDRYAGDDEDKDDEDKEENSEEDDNDDLINSEDKQFYDLLKHQYKENSQQTQAESINNPDLWAKNLEKKFAINNKNNSDIFNPFNKRRTNRDNATGMKFDYRKDTVTMDNSKNLSRHALDFKKTYLFLYNLVMFIMFLKVYMVLIIKGVSGTVDDDIVQGAAFIVKLLTYTQLLETIHPMLGLVPGGPLMPFTQVVGRILVNHFLSESQIRLDSAPYAHYLFVVWTSIEIFRYSFYALRVFKVNIYALTWCRYTLFLPLYPMGGLCESMVIFSTIKYYEKTASYSIDLPNSANFSFYLPLVLRLYTFLLLGPTILYLMRYMWSQRHKQLKEKVA